MLQFNIWTLDHWNHLKLTFLYWHELQKTENFREWVLSVSFKQLTISSHCVEWESFGPGCFFIEKCRRRSKWWRNDQWKKKKIQKGQLSRSFSNCSWWKADRRFWSNKFGKANRRPNCWAIPPECRINAFGRAHRRPFRNFETTCRNVDVVCFSQWYCWCEWSSKLENWCQRKFIWSGWKWKEQHFPCNSASTKSMVAKRTSACAQFGSGTSGDCWDGFRIARASYTCQIWQDSSLHSGLQTCNWKGNGRNFSQNAIAFFLHFWIELQTFWQWTILFSETDNDGIFLWISNHFEWSVARIQRKNCLWCRWISDQRQQTVGKYEWIGVF